MAPEQAAHVGVGRLGRPQLLAQQVDQQQIALAHQLPQWPPGLAQQPLIGVEHQHPVAPHVLQSGIAGWGEIPRPGQLVHDGTAACGDGDGGITGAGVQHHHLVYEAGHRGQAALQPLRFVAHDHREAEHGRGSAHPFQTGRREGICKGDPLTLAAFHFAFNS